MNFKVAKENIQERKEAYDKEKKLSKYIDNELECAEQCVTLALLCSRRSKSSILRSS